MGGANLSLRNVATSRMAHLMGLDNMVAQSKMVRYKYNGEDKKGILMEEAEGDTFANLTNNAEAIGICNASAETFLALNSIQLFDIICGQLDRNIGNYMCKFEKNERGKITSISDPKCIDNDFSFGKVKYKDIAKEQLINNLAFEDDHGLCVLAFLDKKVVDKMEVLLNNKDIIHYAMADLLSKKEIDCIIDRMKGALKIIKRTADKKENFLIDSDDFTFNAEAKAQFSEQKGLNKDSLQCVEIKKS